MSSLTSGLASCAPLSFDEGQAYYIEVISELCVMIVTRVWNDVIRDDFSRKHLNQTPGRALAFCGLSKACGMWQVYFSAFWDTF